MLSLRLERLKPRNPVVQALSASGSKGAGQHGKSGRAQRQADKSALRKALQRGDTP